MMQMDAICALATPQGIGAIGLVRTSGAGSIEKVSALFSGKILDAKSHTVHFGLLKDSLGEVIDEVLITIFHTGRSFTGEESVEISCHASPYILQKVLNTLNTCGFRLALPGEFTQRAFLNGKLDLSQAEAVADLIASESKRSHEIALKQLRGGFSTELRDLREKLIHFASMIELELDFAEEDVQFADRTQLLQLLEEVLAYLKRLMHSFELGNAIKNGVPVAIVGAPNTGKSTLLNALLGEDRAIVSPIAGTTRDVIEETLNIDGITFRLIDTAGIREGAETIEALGIERSMQKIEQASLVLCLSDAGEPNSTNEVALWVKQLQEKHPEKTILHIQNKADLCTNKPEGLCISAKNQENLNILRSTMLQAVLSDFKFGEETIVSNARHFEALSKTSAQLEKAKESLVQGITGDFVAMDIRQAMFELGQITGDISTDDLLGSIFSRFCIGK
jgi:tRNA modification GTPase